ncbi:MAG: hypothetical protein RRZ73_03550, partial [Oscillospiraceae bacterium]
MNIKCVLVDLQQNHIIWNDVTSLYINKSRYTPADYLEISGRFKPNNNNYRQVNIYIDNELVFEGRVDRQEQRLDENGTTLNVECRSLGAAMLDNEAEPREYFSVNGNDIFNAHIRSYGYELLKPLSSLTIPSFKVTNGLSDWDVFAIFCQRVYGSSPFIRSDRKVWIDQTGRFYDLSDYPLKSITRNYDPCNTISHIYVRDNRGYYTTRVDNENLPDLYLSRRHFILPNSQYGGKNYGDAYERIKRSMAKTFSQQAEFAGYIPIEVATTLTLNHQ